MLELGSGTILCADNNLPVIGPFFIIALVQIISGCRIVSAFSKPEDRDISFIYFFASVYFGSGCRVVYVPLMNWIIYKVLDCCCCCFLEGVTSQFLQNFARWCAIIVMVVNC